RRHTRFSRDWSSDVCSSDLDVLGEEHGVEPVPGGVGGGDGFGFGVEGLDDDDRAEDLFVPVARGRVDAGEDGRAYGPAVAEPAGQHRAGRVLDVGADFGVVGLAGEGAEFGGRVLGVAEAY